MFDVGIFDVTNDDLMMLDEPPPSFVRKSPNAASVNRIDKKVRIEQCTGLLVHRPLMHNS